MPRPEADGAFDWYDAPAAATGYVSTSEEHPASATPRTKRSTSGSGTPHPATEAPNAGDNHPGVTLDQSAFPHIFEQIYDNNPPPRSHFRGIARYLHRKVDTENVKHLALASSGDSKGLALLSGENKGAALSFRDAFNTSSWGFKKGYWFYVDLSSASPVLHRSPLRAVNLATNTMAVDIVGCPPLPFFKSTIADGQTPVQLYIVRAIPTPSSWGVQEESIQNPFEGSQPSVNRVTDIIKAQTLVLFTRPRGPLLKFRPKHPSGFGERRLVVNIGPPVDVEPSTNWYGGSSGASSSHVFPEPQIGGDIEVPQCAPPSDIPERVAERIYIFDKAWAQWQLDNGALGFIIESIAHQIVKALDHGTMPSQPKWILVGVELLSRAVIGTHDPISGHPLQHHYDALYHRRSLPGPFCKPQPDLPKQQSRQYAENKYNIVAAVAVMVMYCSEDYSPEYERRVAEFIKRVVEFRTVDQHQQATFPPLWQLQTIGYPWHTQTKEQMMAKP